MKITDVEVIHLRAGDPGAASFDGSYEACVVRIRTDSGLEGIGETESFAPAVRAIVEGPSSHAHARSLRDVLAGRDPADPETLWEEMYGATESVGRRGLVMHAIGGVDLALWDLRGRVGGKPVCELLGAKRRDRIPAYGTLYPIERTPDGVKRQIEQARAANLRHVKVCADPWWLDDIELTASLLRAAREALEPGALLIVDAALSYRSAEDGLRLLPALREAGVWFLEAPLPLDDVDGHARLAREGFPLGIGDLGLTHVDEFVAFAERGAGDVWQPDISMVGGFTGLARVAAEARAREIPVVPHGYRTSILVAANAQFLAAQPEDGVLMEYSLSASPLRHETTVERLPVQEDGSVLVPEGPGLGVTLNEETVARYAFTPHPEPQVG
jgi:L-alanine-DL-glutamate epimerase-like enolase superfamily enzyme